MDINKYLVMLQGKDKTEKVEEYKFESNLVNIRYKNSKTLYKYKIIEFEFFKEPEIIDLKNNEVILANGYACNVEKILKFNKYYKIFFKDETTLVQFEGRVTIVKKAIGSLSNNRFDYYREILEIISCKTEEGKAILSTAYNKINYISEDLALYKYLTPYVPINKLNTNLENIIFPFGTNKSQFQAVKNAMSNQISIIEGPPGTGKTQTILNIIANIIKEGKTVAVVSNSNPATDNVYEKLKNYELDYICAKLGKKEKREEFINNQTGEYPEFQNITEDENIIEDKITSLNKLVNEIFELQNDIAKLRTELDEIKLQYEHYKKNEGDKVYLPKIRKINNYTTKHILKFKIEYEEKEKLNLWLKIKAILIYGIGNKEFYKKSKQDIIECFNRLFYIIKEIETKKEINKKQNRLKFLGEEKIVTLKKESLKLLNKKLLNKYGYQQKRRIFEYKEMYNNSQSFTEEYPVVFSTTHAIKDCVNKEYKFDYVIMDEATQVDLITGILSLSVAKNAVIVGDLNQLPNVISIEVKNKIEEISKKYEINEEYNYLKQSFLSSINKILINAPRTLLREHYRCHPKIIQFSNKKFYNDELIIMTEDKGENDILKAYITTKGNHEREHINQRQIDVIENEIMSDLTKKVNMTDIGIISPYKNQTKELQKTFGQKLKIDTVHKFQGREEKAIVITTVDNEIGDFVDNPNMLNVAVTRAQNYLRLVISNNEKNEGTNTADLLKYIKYNNFEVIESTTKSIYDLLYKENRKERLEYLKNKRKISEYDSENLTYNLIEEVIKENNYSNIDIAVHVPLKDILANINLLNEEELAYIYKTWTHVDFILYNKMDKKVFLAIEVDGYYYHKEGTEQQKRDMIKDKILQKYKIPLLRFSTIGSGEKEKLEVKIKNIV